MHHLASVAASLSVLAASIAAQSVAVPAAQANLRSGQGLNTILRNAGAPRTYMMGIVSSELTGIPAGSYINGLSFRVWLSTTQVASWPASQVNWSAYTIRIGNAIPVSTWTTTFANNFSGTPVQARTGALALEAGTFLNNSALPAPQPNPWSNFFFDFQVPFLYTGGDLAIYMTHPGSSDATTVFLDAVTSSPFGYGVAMSDAIFNSTTATTNPQTLYVTRIHYGQGTGCPGTGGFVPQLVQSNDITGGGSVTFGLGNAPANGAAVLIVGANLINLPLPNGCRLYTNPTIVIPMTLSALGRAQLTASFPAGSGLVAHVQGVAIDFGATDLFTTTNSVSLTVNP